MTQSLETNPSLREFFSRLVLFISSEDSTIAQGSAEAFVNTAFKAGTTNVLRNYLLFEQEAIANEIPQDVISSGLRRAATYAEQKKDGFYEVICRLFKIAAEFWHLRGTYSATDVGRLVNDELKVLESPSLENSKYRDGMNAFFRMSRNLLSEFSYAEDTVPLKIPVAESKSKEEILKEMLCGYPTADGVATVLKHFANEELYPLKPFLLKLEDSQKTLNSQVESKKLLVPDEVILNTIILLWKGATESAIKYKSARLKCYPVGEWVYFRDPTQVTLRLVLENISDGNGVVGETRNVRIVVEQPSGRAKNPNLASTPVILSWETGVTYDLIIDFGKDLEPGKKKVSLRIIFDDLTENNRELLESFEIELKPWVVVTPNKYDPVVADEVRRVTGDEEELKRLLEDELNTDKPYPVSLEDVDGAVSRLGNKDTKYFQSKWNSLDQSKKQVLVEVQRILSENQSQHIKMIDIVRALVNKYQRQDVNWTRLVRELVYDKWLIEENGLYRFRAGLLRAWTASFGTLWLERSLEEEK